MLECSQLSIERLSASDDPEHIVRAELLRELLLKRCDTPQDPRGLRLRSARITGTLDLDHIEAAVGLELRDCSVAPFGLSPSSTRGRHDQASMGQECTTGLPEGA